MNEPTTLSPAPKPRGCLFYGCLTSVVLLLLAGLLGFLAVRFVRNKINSYTEAQPLKMPRVEMTDAEFQVLEQRVKSFTGGLEQGKALDAADPHRARPQCAPRLVGGHEGAGRQSPRVA